MLQQFVDMPSSITPMHSKLTLVPMHSNMSLDSPLVLQYMVRQPSSFDRWATGNQRRHAHAAHGAQ